MGSFDHLFKVLVVGDSAVGKTSFLHRYVHDIFGKEYKMTMGVDFALKVVQWSDMETIRLQLWDIAGQERFTSMTRLYYKQASGCIIMFDLTNADSFRSCQMWKEDLDSKVALPSGSLVPCILLANKCDMTQWAVSREQIDTFSKENNFIGWTETSVKDNININESMRVLIERMMESRDLNQTSSPPQGEYINLKDISGSGSGCC
ncbi:ras-related protein Rab-7L1 [Spea bombifrons]|uniref:ras-related protein Rab-7L1 n=1 Tax=Spea bombifrons TaxID=233779 RepID=UPI00234AE23C|nr:ras-related protein Rab-7L1 [Spea bombifrons]